MSAAELKVEPSGLDFVSREVIKAALDLRDFGRALMAEEDFDRRPVGKRLLRIGALLNELAQENKSLRSYLADAPLRVGPAKCPNPHCENGLIRGTNGAVGCAVCNAPIRLGAPTIATADEDDPWFYCIKCGAGWDAPFDESGCPSCWLYAYLENPEIGAAVRAALKKYCGACGGPWSEHPRVGCSAQRETTL